MIYMVLQIETKDETNFMTIIHAEDTQEAKVKAVEIWNDTDNLRSINFMNLDYDEAFGWIDKSTDGRFAWTGFAPIFFFDNCDFEDCLDDELDFVKITYEVRNIKNNQKALREEWKLVPLYRSDWTEYNWYDLVAKTIKEAESSIKDSIFEFNVRDYWRDGIECEGVLIS